ncbi:hypothetical protein [Roseomonas populi]|uniref:Uncharacterized protein n=1 Tax=Roseomonas populi TaxID=3121582 RepID=A0ABT1WYT7_9PROT|nr:hypothetical protein [Roseomonas pecuniae]MCR0980619.1 hypothetical protein [Roseomonas pecuniae]
MSNLEGRVAGLEAATRAIGSDVTDLKVAIAKLPGRWELVALIVGTAIACTAAMISMQANLLSAFQSGLSAVSTAVAVRTADPPPSTPPQIIVVPQLTTPPQSIPQTPPQPGATQAPP